MQTNKHHQTLPGEMPDVSNTQELKSLQSDVNHFFINYPPEELRKLLWQLYSAWVYNSADHVTKEDIHNMLFFYEQIGDFMDNSYRLSKALEQPATITNPDANLLNIAG